MADAFGAISVALDVTKRNIGAFVGALSGKTFVVKENIDVAGYVSRNGNPSWAASHSPAALDAPAVDRLLAAGARLVGKTQMDEMAYSLLGANHHYGTPVNPAAKDRHPADRRPARRSPSLLDSPISRSAPTPPALAARPRPSAAYMAFGRRMALCRRTASSCSRRRTTSSAGSRATSKC